MERRDGGGVATLPSARRGAIDVARVGSLVLVVLGHLSLAVLDRGADGALRGANLMALHPNLAWIAAFAPMPVFFAAAGWANAGATVSSAAPRLRSLVGLAAMVVTGWFTAAAVTALLRDDAGLIGDAARVATRPVWFLAAYVPLAALGDRISRIAIHPFLVVGTGLAVLAVLDLARFWLSAPRVLGWPGFYLAWGVPWVLGASWRRRWEHGSLHERRVGAVMTAAALAVAVALVGLLGYYPSLIDAVSGERSNTTPPTVYTAVAAIGQVGILMVMATALDRVAARHRCALDRAGPLAIGVYIWHLTALVLCAAAIAAGLWAPTRLTVAWWITRPPWFVAVLVITALLVAATAVARGSFDARAADDHPRRFTGTGVLWSGVAASTIGAALVGLEGPRSAPAAVTALVLLLAGWWWLGATSLPSGPRTRPSTSPPPVSFS